MAKYASFMFVCFITFWSGFEVYGQSDRSVRGESESERQRSGQSGFRDKNSSSSEAQESSSNDVMDLKKLELLLTASIKRFQASSSKFGVSANTEDLIENAGHLDRMVVEMKLVRRFEKKAEAMGLKGVVKLRQKMEEAIHSYSQVLYSDAAAIQTKAAYENAMMYLRDF